MDKLKVGDGPFDCSNNVEMVQMLFGKPGDQDEHKYGVYKIKENKYVSFIYLAIKQPNGEWKPPSGASKNFKNIPNSDNSEFIRECCKERLKEKFTNPSDEFAIFTKTSKPEYSFYGIFMFKEENEDYSKCTFKRISTELNFEEWK